MTLLLVLSSAVAIVVSFVCSLMESLLLSLNPLTLNHLATKRPRSAQAWRRLKRNITQPITAILVLNTIAHTGGATIAGSAFSKQYGAENIWIFSIIFTIIILFGTEILPKIIGVTFRNQLAPYAGPVLEILTWLLWPIIQLSDFLFKRLTAEHEPEQITTADLVTLASMARSGKAINLEQENIIVNAVRLSHTQVSHAMIQAKDVHFITNTDSIDMIKNMVIASGHSRYPVSRSQHFQDVFAFVQINRLIPLNEAELIQQLQQTQPLHSVDVHGTLLNALRIILEHKQHLLVVVNEHKHAVGIVTLEDIASELLSTDLGQFH